MCRIVNDCKGLCHFGRKGGFHPHGVNGDLFPELCGVGPEWARLSSASVPTVLPSCCRPIGNGSNKENRRG